MSVQRVDACNLMVVDEEWPFATEHAVEIDRNWKEAVAENPKLFDGDVFVVDRWAVDQGILSGVSVPTKFSAYLYWRHAGGVKTRYTEAFAATVLVTRDGGILLARAAAGTLNEYRYGSPGGLFDPRDVDEGGRIDVSGAAARELWEETGLSQDELVRVPGLLLAHVAPYLAIASVFQSPASGAELQERLATYLKSQEDAELEAPCVVYSTSELNRLELTPFAHLLTEHVLGM